MKDGILTPPLIVIVGSTASGKSALAMSIASKYSGEIICADSRTVYKGMDIGTAKPSQADRSAVKHHLLDIVSPDQVFTAAEFKRRAQGAITDISLRGRVPIMVGGTGLYVDGVIYDYAFLPPASHEEREYLQTLSVEELQGRIIDLGIAMPKNSKNPRHLIRAIETNGAIPVKRSLRENTLLVGIDISREVIVERIGSRVDDMLEYGFLEEVRDLSEKYSWNSPGLLAPGYKAFRSYINGDIDLEEAKRQFAIKDYQLARRQRTWFKRNKSIHWIKKPTEADALVDNFLQKIAQS